MKVSNGAKIRNRYNQVPHLTQDTNGKASELFRKYPKTPVFDHSNYRLFERISVVPGTSNNRGLTVFDYMFLTAVRNEVNNLESSVVIQQLEFAINLAL